LFPEEDEGGFSSSDTAISLDFCPHRAEAVVERSAMQRETVVLEAGVAVLLRPIIKYFGIWI
jgi:hypothetical protein